ncbi:MAG TPA: DUF2167 domain-containing protein [Candidatus Binatia bacterium]|nr:DUF2167 domain-containing protein [Candidatus Binatia bacterium]
MRLGYLLLAGLLVAPSARAALPTAPRTAVQLGPGVSLSLPAGFRIVTGPRARRILADIGNVPPKDRFALVSPPGADWFIEVAWVEEGYVRDADARTLDATALLAAVRADTARTNAATAARGFSPLRVEGWGEQPRYERSRHVLLWSVALRDDDGAVMNLGARILGRRGYVRLNLAAAPADYAVARRAVARLMDAVAFAPGAAYDDFHPQADAVAPYALGALVAGPAAGGG